MTLINESLVDAFPMGDFDTRTQIRQHDTYRLGDPEMMHSISLKKSGTCANRANSGLDSTDSENIYQAYVLDISYQQQNEPVVRF